MCLCRRICVYCGHSWQTSYLQTHWHTGINGGTKCPERGKYFANGLAKVFNDEDDKKALKDFEDYNIKSVTVENGNYEVV
jgi:hypothetical protein